MKPWCLKKGNFIWVSMYLAWKYELRTLFLRLLLERGPPFYVVIQATGRSTHLQGKQRQYLHFSVSLRPGLSIGLALGIEPVTSRSTVKRSTDWANPAAVLQCHSVTCTAGFSRSRHLLTSGDHPLNLIKKMQIKDQSILDNLHWLNYWRQKLRGNVDWGDLSHQHLR